MKTVAERKEEWRRKLMLGSKSGEEKKGRAKWESGLLPILIVCAEARGSQRNMGEGGEKSEEMMLGELDFFIRYHDYDVTNEGSSDSPTFLLLSPSPIQT